MKEAGRSVEGEADRITGRKFSELAHEEYAYISAKADGKRTA